MTKIFAAALIIALFGLTFFLRCKSAQAVSTTNAARPPEQYANTVNNLEPPVSTLTIPVSIALDDLMRSLNTKLSGAALYEDFSYSDNNNDGLMMNAWKSQDITASISGNELRYRLPLKLWMKKSLPVGAAEGEGELALAFKTKFELNADWSLSTQTIVEYHEWLRKPVLKTGLGDINIESLSNIVLNRSKNTLASAIDKAVSQQLSLRPYVEEVWKAIQEPTQISEEYKMWVKTTPVNIGMTRLSTSLNVIRAKIAVDCTNDVSFGDKPNFRENSRLPNLKIFDQVKDDFEMHFATDVPYPEAERLAKLNMVGYVMESGKRKVRVDDLQLWGNDDRLVINTKLSGSFNGNIYFLARPVFNAAKNQVEVTDLDYHFDTKNMLLKSAGWLFQGPIKKKMKESMAFPLHENIAALKKSVQETLNYYEIQPGIVLKGGLDSIAVENIQLQASGIRVNLYSKGKINVDVKGL
jgi:Domain of unknown function (DUF4403)